ncbi:MAG: ribosomal protein S18-alanine N-acetyltransferase [Planctomycetota bacterium]|jgi:ribosomal-protein-alanine N-acetyltransferase
MEERDVTRVVAIETASFSSAWHADTFRSLLHRPAAELWVMDHEEDGVIGYSVLWCILDQGELANIAIADGHRGRGLGAHLLGRMLDVGRERDVASVYLEVRASNQAAIGLYERFGFAQIGVRRRYYDQPREDALVMLARL